MKIIRTAPYSITVEDKGARTKILGESFVRGHGSPDFIIHSNSIQCWEIVDIKKNIPINEIEKKSIFDYVLKELRGRGWNIESE